MSPTFVDHAKTYGFTLIAADHDKHVFTDARGQLWVTVLASEEAATNNRRLFAARKYLDAQFSA